MSEAKAPTYFGEDRDITVSAAALAAASLFASKEETRYYLNGVYITPHHDGGVLCVATDGHRMGVVWDETGAANAPWICSLPSAIHAAIMKRRGRDPFCSPSRVHFRAGAAYVLSEAFPSLNDPLVLSDAHLAVAYAPPIEGSFPDWRRVFAPVKEGETSTPIVGFNPAYLASFGRAAEILKGGPKHVNCVQLIMGSKPGDPVAVHLEGVSNFTGVIMPMRGDDLSFAKRHAAFVQLPDDEPSKSEAA